LQDDGFAARCLEVGKTYWTATGEIHALRGLTADFPVEAVTAVAGPSGSGKSSLLRLLAGIDRPTSGSLVVGGVQINTARSRTLRRLRRGIVGYVFQRPSDNFFPHLTVGEHLRVATRASSRPLPIDASELLELLGITHRTDHRPGELSGGEQQRAAFAQILAAGPRIVVADEPTAELDRVSSGHVLDAIASLVARGVTFILATHDSDLVRRADHVLRLDHGVLAAIPSVWRPGTAQKADLSTQPSTMPGTPLAEPRLERSRVLSVRDVSKSYRRGAETVHAVRRASLDVLEGELVGLLGRSGSGKTTLLNIVAGWERPDSGRVWAAGRDRPETSPTWSEVAVVPQKLGLIEELTIRENVEYPARLSGSLDRVEWLVDELIGDLGLSALQHRYPLEASVGEQQRAALARALVLSPRLVLADEPTGHQDLEWARGVLEALRRAVAKGTACLAASHNEELVRYLDRALSMSDGELIEKTAG
jgi:ABC-type lipoprotein export system ATPase subunit